MGENEAKPTQQSFLSKLRQRSAIIFTIGLAISVASFVENLHMGKAGIVFVVDELSKIQGLEDIVRATAAIFHGALEWWRGVLRGLFSFLPFEIPQWLHDPISVAFFASSRALEAFRALVVSQMHMTITSRQLFSTIFSALSGMVMAAVMVSLIFADQYAFNVANQSATSIALVAVVGFFFVVSIIARALFNKRQRARIREHERFRSIVDKANKKSSQPIAPGQEHQPSSHLQRTSSIPISCSL